MANEIKKSKEVLSILSNDMSTLGFIMRWVSGVLSIVWLFIIGSGVFAMWRMDLWSYWPFLAVPAFLLGIQARLTWKYRMFKPSDMLTQKQIEDKIKDGTE